MTTLFADDPSPAAPAARRPNPRLFRQAAQPPTGYPGVAGVPHPPVITGGGTPATASMGAPTGIPAAQPGTFSAGSNLVNRQLTPAADPRLSGAQGQTDTARNALAGFQSSAFTPVGPANTAGSTAIYDQLLKAINTPTATPNFGGGDFAAFGGQAKTLLDRIVNGPDRGKLAADQYRLLQEQDAPRFEQDLRTVGKKAAALGRIGAGMTTSELGDVATLRNRALEQGGRQLAVETAGLQRADDLAALDAVSRAQGTVGGALSGAYGAAEGANRDRINNLFRLGDTTYGRERDTYGDTVSERDKGLGYEDTLYGRRRSTLGDLSGEEQRLTGNARLDREEGRTERGYQYGLSRDATDDRVRQRLLEEQLLGGEFGRGQQQIDTLGRLGFQGDPTGLLYGAGRDKAAQGADTLGGAGDLLQLLFQQRGRTAAGAPPAVRIPDVNIPVELPPWLR